MDLDTALEPAEPPGLPFPGNATADVACTSSSQQQLQPLPPVPSVQAACEPDASPAGQDEQPVGQDTGPPDGAVRFTFLEGLTAWLESILGPESWGLGEALITSFEEQQRRHAAAGRRQPAPFVPPPALLTLAAQLPPAGQGRARAVREQRALLAELETDFRAHQMVMIAHDICHDGATNSPATAAGTASVDSPTRRHRFGSLSFGLGSVSAHVKQIMQRQRELDDDMQSEDAGPMSFGLLDWMATREPAARFIQMAWRAYRTRKLQRQQQEQEPQQAQPSGKAAVPAPLQAAPNAADIGDPVQQQQEQEQQQQQQEQQQQEQQQQEQQQQEQQQQEQQQQEQQQQEQEQEDGEEGEATEQAAARVMAHTQAVLDAAQQQQLSAELSQPRVQSAAAGGARRSRGPVATSSPPMTPNVAARYLQPRQPHAQLQGHAYPIYSPSFQTQQPHDAPVSGLSVQSLSLQLPHDHLRTCGAAGAVMGRPLHHLVGQTSPFGAQGLQQQQQQLQSQPTLEQLLLSAGSGGVPVSAVRVPSTVQMLPQHTHVHPHSRHSHTHHHLGGTNTGASTRASAASSSPSRNPTAVPSPAQQQRHASSAHLQAPVSALSPSAPPPTPGGDDLVLRPSPLSRPLPTAHSSSECGTPASAATHHVLAARHASASGQGAGGMPSHDSGLDGMEAGPQQPLIMQRAEAAGCCARGVPEASPVQAEAGVELYVPYDLAKGAGWDGEGVAVVLAPKVTVQQEAGIQQEQHHELAPGAASTGSTPDAPSAPPTPAVSHATLGNRSVEHVAEPLPPALPSPMPKQPSPAAPYASAPPSALDLPHSLHSSPSSSPGGPSSRPSPSTPPSSLPTSRAAKLVPTSLLPVRPKSPSASARRSQGGRASWGNLDVGGSSAGGGMVGSRGASFSNIDSSPGGGLTVVGGRASLGNLDGSGGGGSRMAGGLAVAGGWGNMDLLRQEQSRGAAGGAGAGRNSWSKLEGGLAGTEEGSGLQGVSSCSELFPRAPGSPLAHRLSGPGSSGGRVRSRRSSWSNTLQPPDGMLGHVWSEGRGEEPGVGVHVEVHRLGLMSRAGGRPDGASGGGTDVLEVQHAGALSEVAGAVYGSTPPPPLDAWGVSARPVRPSGFSARTAANPLKRPNSSSIAARAQAAAAASAAGAAAAAQGLPLVPLIRTAPLQRLDDAAAPPSSPRPPLSPSSARSALSSPASSSPFKGQGPSPLSCSSTPARPRTSCSAVPAAAAMPTLHAAGGHPLRPFRPSLTAPLPHHLSLSALDGTEPPVTKTPSPSLPPSALSKCSLQPGSTLTAAPSQGAPCGTQAAGTEPLLALPSLSPLDL